jgi:transposase
VRAIGLDVHRDFCEVAIAEQGRVRSAGRVKTRPDVIELFAQSLAADDRVVLEVTGNAWEIARIIEPHVARVVVVSPSDTGIRHARAKTDRLDARTLAKLLAAGTLDSVWMPDERTRGDAPSAGATLAVGGGAHAREERGSRDLDPAPERPPGRD